MNGDSLFMLLNKKLKDIKESNKRQENILTQTSNEIVNVKNSVSGVQTSCDEIKGKFDNIQVDIDPNMIKNAVNDLLYETKIESSRIMDGQISQSIYVGDFTQTPADHNAEIELYSFTAQKHGYYRFDFNQAYGSYADYYIKINGVKKQTWYVSQGEPIVQYINANDKVVFSAKSGRSGNKIGFTAFRYSIIEGYYLSYLSEKTYTFTPTMDGVISIIILDDKTNLNINNMNYKSQRIEEVSYIHYAVNKKIPITISTGNSYGCKFIIGYNQYSAQTSKVVKSIQRGRTFVERGKQTKVSIAPVNTSRCLIWIDADMRSCSGGSSYNSYQCYIQDFTNNYFVIASPDQSSNSTVNLYWQIIEF